MKWLVLLLAAFTQQAFSQDATETRELIGNLGGRAALINLYATERPDANSGAGTLDEEEVLVHAQILQHVRSTTHPADFDSFDAIPVAEPKV